MSAAVAVTAFIVGLILKYTATNGLSNLEQSVINLGGEPPTWAIITMLFGLWFIIVGCVSTIIFIWSLV